MKKLIFIVIFISCTTNQANIENVETVSTTPQKIVNNTTTTSTTIYDWEEHYLMLDNFEEAWEKSLKDPITLSEEEKELTEYLYSIWTWKGDKWTPENENFYELKVNGQICRRIWNSMGYAWLDEIHPVENMFTDGYVVTERYMCDSNLDFEKNSLFGAPFYYQNRWWIYQTYEFTWDQVDCKNPCAKSVQYHGTRVSIDLDDEIYQIILPDK
tara:strand:+ start:1110 stop:1748 length:639 start_codon:yes stop_codon:yes gene_type:complete